MDGLRSQARNNFLRTQHFEPQRLESTIPLITVRKTVSGDTSIEHEGVRPIEVVHQATQPIGEYENRAIAASLRIVRIDGDADGVLYVSGKTFIDLFEAFDLDFCWLSMLQQSVYGFHHLQCPPSPLKSSNPFNFYLKTVLYTLLWSYNPADASTKAIMITRIACSQRYHDELYCDFVQSVSIHRDLVDDPRFCSFITGINLVSWLHYSILQQLDVIRGVEIETGHGTWTSSRQRSDRPVTQRLVELSKETGLSLSYLANLPRHVCIAKILLQNFNSLGTGSNAMSVSKIEEVATFLADQVNAAENSVSYLQERARTQQSVVNISPTSAIQLIVFFLTNSRYLTS